MRLLIIVLATLLVTIEAQERPRQALQEMQFKCGVLHAPPFATVEEVAAGGVVYGGVQSDLLNQMKQFALEDNILVDFDLKPSPAQYGAAFNLVANDCNTTANPNTLEACNEFDIIVANFYSTPSRSLRANLSPSWMRSTISTMKWTDKSKQLQDVTTMQQASDFGVPVCLKTDTFYAGVVSKKFPSIKFESCGDQDVCIAKLKAQDCGLYASDELQLRFRRANDNTLEVTPESFNTQYITWAMKDSTPNVRWVKKWIYQAVTNTTMDQLYFKYFQKELCPIGSAGETCELPCNPDHGEADESGKCICKSTKWTSADCSIEVPHDKNLIGSGLKTVAYLMVAVNLTTIIGLVCWMIWKRKSPQIRLSQPFFLSLVLLGCAISTSTILPMMAESEGNGPVPACMAVPWLYSVGFSITFGCLFAKIRRVYLIFKSAADFRRTKVTLGETFSLTAAVLFLDITILLIWTVVDPLKWERTVTSEDKFGEPLASEGICNCQYWEFWVGSIALLHGGLLAIACFFCYQARDISTKISEGKYVSMAMFSNLQIFVVGLPILIILGSNSGAGFFVRTVIIWMNDLVVVSLIFGNLIYHVHFHPSRGVTREIGSAIRKFTVAKKERDRRGANSHSSLSVWSSRFEMPSVAEREEEEASPPDEASTHVTAPIRRGNSSDRRKESVEIPPSAKPLDKFPKSSWGGIELESE